MASSLHFIAVLCLTIGLWTGASAQCGDCCEPCKTCPSGWTQFQDHCYIYHHASKDWADAEVSCIADGGNLATVQKPDVQAFVKKLINTATNKDDQTWVGATDSSKEGVWMWNDGSPFTGKGFWGKGQPDNAGKREHCLELNYRGAPNDVPCHLKRPYVCGKRL
ncbi:galactose-specific lectin nattectin-like [Epinephelus fuscoguttatus]|uniref:galactose-specific lectin nattectin-like n=1 Tax=Epinephelus fuscoguttatus TaxID=293821 RepID=UPI0020D1DA76|nr:galactose-specific lectin nattectin-like [Epinephelus fuscoguttatus]